MLGCSLLILHLFGEAPELRGPGPHGGGGARGLGVDGLGGLAGAFGPPLRAPEGRICLALFCQALRLCSLRKLRSRWHRQRKWDGRENRRGRKRREKKRKRSNASKGKCD